MGTVITVDASYTDGGETLESVSSAATVAVGNVNDAPTGSVTIDKTAPSQGEVLTASNDLADTDGVGTITYQWKRNSIDIADASSPSYTLVQADVGFAITATASYTDDGGNQESVTSAQTAAVINVNDAPDANNDSAGVQPSNSVVIDVLANDTDVDSDDSKTVVSVGAVSGTAGGTVERTNDGANVTFTASTGAGTDSFTYTMQDTAGSQSTATVTVTVTSNATPVIVHGPLTVDMDEDSLPNQFAAPTISATDAESDTLIWSLGSEASDGEAMVIGTDVSSPTVSYTPDLNFNGTDSFVVQVSDGTSSASITVSVNVSAKNDPPVAVDDNDSTPEDTPFTTINVLTNDTDVDEDTRSVLAADVSSENGGVVVDNADGTFNYMPSGDYFGEDTFSYTVSDGNGGNDTATVIIFVTEVNDAPVATDDSEVTTVNTSFTTGNVLANDTDVDSATLGVVPGNPSAANGAVVNNNDGTFTYTPNTDFTGTDSFSYSVSDSLLSDEGTVNITVNVNGDPATMSVLLGTGIGGLESYFDGTMSQFDTFRDVYDPIAGTLGFVDKSFDYSSGLFVPEAEGPDELWLTSTGTWEFNAETLPVLTADNSDGSMTVSVRNSGDTGDTEEVGRFKLSALTVDISGEPMGNYLSTEWNAQLTNSNALFGVGALQVTSYTFEPLIDSYNIYVDNECEFSNPDKFAALDENCNAVMLDDTNNIPATTLDQVIAGTAWVDPEDSTTNGLVAISVSFNSANNTELLAELVSGSNTVNYYVHDYTATDPFDAVTPVLTNMNGWVRDSSIKNTDMIRYEIPTSLQADFPEISTAELTRLLAVQNDAVRNGIRQLAGAPSFETEPNTMNGIAMDEVLANFTPPVSTLDVSLAGTWRPTVAQNNPDDFLSLTFFADGTYTHGQVFSDENETSGMEWGTYSRDSATGLLTVTQTFDNNGGTGLTDFVGAGGPSAYADVVGDELTLSIDETGSGEIDTTIVFQRAVSSGFLGTWKARVAQFSPDDFLSLSFFDDGTYTHMEIDFSDEDEISGMEWGTYSLDPATGLLTVTQEFDNNGGTGLTDYVGAAAPFLYVDLVNDVLTGSWDENGNGIIDGTAIFDRSFVETTGASFDLATIPGTYDIVLSDETTHYEFIFNADKTGTVDFGFGIENFTWDVDIQERLLVDLGEGGLPDRFTLTSGTFKSGTFSAEFDDDSNGTYESLLTGDIVETGGGTNVAPIANDDAGITLEGGSVTIDLVANDTDTDGTALTALTLGAATNGSIVDNGDGSVIYMHDGGETTNDSFTYTVSDGNGGSASATVSVTITPVNDLPTIAGTPATTINNGATYTFIPTAEDVDGQALTFSIQNMPAWATFTLADGTLSGIPALSDVGGDFSNIIISVISGSDTVTLPEFAITVNSAPVGSAVWDQFNWDDGSTWQ
ncbi:MAG: hypothetical protein ACI9JR_001319 [Gammaproteobacteria bacterium]